MVVAASGSHSSAVTMNGPIGLNVSLFLHRQKVRSVRCQPRTLTSFPIVQPKIPARASAELACRSRDLYGMEVNFRAEVWPALYLDETDASHLYRIAQEALTNAARHGRATRVDIFLLVVRSTFSLYITDNGEGFCMPMSPYRGMGLKIMKYRAGMLGAKFEIAPSEPRGTVVRVIGEQPLTAAPATGARH